MPLYSTAFASRRSLAHPEESFAPPKPSFEKVMKEHQCWGHACGTGGGGETGGGSEPTTGDHPHERANSKEAHASAAEYHKKRRDEVAKEINKNRKEMQSGRKPGVRQMKDFKEKQRQLGKLADLHNSAHTYHNAVATGGKAPGQFVNAGWQDDQKFNAGQARSFSRGARHYEARLAREGKGKVSDPKLGKNLSGGKESLNEYVDRRTRETNVAQYERAHKSDDLESVLKYNPHHGADGRFTSGGGGLSRVAQEGASFPRDYVRRRPEEVASMRKAFEHTMSLRGEPPASMTMEFHPGTQRATPTNLPFKPEAGPTGYHEGHSPVTLYAHGKHSGQVSPHPGHTSFSKKGDMTPYQLRNLNNPLVVVKGSPHPGHTDLSTDEGGDTPKERSSPYKKTMTHTGSLDSSGKPTQRSTFS